MAAPHAALQAGLYPRVSSAGYCPTCCTRRRKSSNITIGANSMGLVSFMTIHRAQVPKAAFPWLATLSVVCKWAGDHGYTPQVRVIRFHEGKYTGLRLLRILAVDGAHTASSRIKSSIYAIFAVVVPSERGRETTGGSQLSPRIHLYTAP